MGLACICITCSFWLFSFQTNKHYDQNYPSILVQKSLSVPSFPFNIMDPNWLCTSAVEPPTLFHRDGLLTLLWLPMPCHNTNIKSYHHLIPPSFFLLKFNMFPFLFNLYSMTKNLNKERNPRSPRTWGVSSILCEAFFAYSLYNFNFWDKCLSNTSNFPKENK